MKFTDVIKDSVLEGFSYTDITTTKIVITLVIAFAIAMYIHLIYKFVTKTAFYYKNYGVSMTIMSVVTAGILLAMQSSLVISLGMVGALSIVRFRTAIKDPMDLLFLFWSIGNGIICGAGLYELAIIVSVVATIGILIFQALPIRKCSYLLVINADSKERFDEILKVVNKQASSGSLKAKNISKDSMELIFEIRLKGTDAQLVDELMAVTGVIQVNILENESEVKA
jgi:uncharacterized membrane protein YhiD involved in acid resistance